MTEKSQSPSLISRSFSFIKKGLPSLFNPLGTTNTKNGWGKSQESETQKKSQKTKTPMGQIVQDTSVCVTPDGNEMSGKKNQNPSTENYHKLDNDQKVEIVKMLAEFHSVPEIQYEIKRKYGLDISIATVLNYKTAEKWLPMYKKFRKEYTDAVESVPGAHKRVRLERMERMWEKAESDEDVKNAISVTEHQRKEIEGDGNKHQGDNILIQFNGMSDEELQKELNSTIEYIKKLEKKKVIDAEVTNVIR